MSAFNENLIKVPYFRKVERPKRVAKHGKIFSEFYG